MHKLIGERISESKNAVQRSLVTKISDIANDSNLDDDVRKQQFDNISHWIWQFFEDGEIDACHKDVLLDVLMYWTAGKETSDAI